MQNQETPDRRGSKPVALAVVFAAIALVVGLSGCGSVTSTTSTQQSSAALDAYVNKMGPMVEAQLGRYADIYSDFTVESQGSQTLVYRYTFRSAVSEQGRTALEAQESTLRETARSQVMPEMRNAGIDDPSVKWIYQDPDGTVVTEITAE